MPEGPVATVDLAAIAHNLGRVRARLDSVRVRGWDDPIEAIYRLSREQADIELGWDRES